MYVKYIGVCYTIPSCEKDSHHSLLFVVSSSKRSKLCMSQRSLSIDEKEVQRELDSLDLILEKLQVQNEVPLHCKLDLAPVACDANSNTCHTVTKY